MKRLLLMPLRYLGWRRGSASPMAPPDRIYIETTNRCNLRCPQCPTGLEITGRPKGDIDEALFGRIVREVAPWAHTAVLHVWGEPLLNENLESMISTAARLGLFTEISSNAMLLDEARARALIRSGLGRIYLCIDGADAGTYEKIRVGGDFLTVKRNIERFIALNAEAGCPVAVKVQLIDIDLTRDQIGAFRKEWTRPGVEDVNIKAFDSWGGRVERINALNAGQCASAVPGSRYPCPNLWYHAHIFNDGSLVCCDRDFELLNPLGNVKDGVLSAWRGEAMRRLRSDHACNAIDKEPCAGCMEWAWWKPRLLSSWGNAPRTD
jgi:hypothetical protein